MYLRKGEGIKKAVDWEEGACTLCAYQQPWEKVSTGVIMDVRPWLNRKQREQEVVYDLTQMLSKDGYLLSYLNTIGKS